MFATGDGGLWHTIRRPDGWTGLGDVKGAVGDPGAVVAVAAAGDGLAGETQFAFATIDGNLWHTTRYPGSWSGLGLLNTQLQIPGFVTAVAAAGDGLVGETQLICATADGQMWHSIRRPDETWTALDDVTAELGIPLPVLAVAGTGDGVAGEAQFMLATVGGSLWHTTRDPNGIWTNLGLVDQEFAIPGAVNAVSAAWDAVTS
jgi:hypothetical protein